MTILVAYATKKGSTREVAEAVAATLRERGLDVDFLPAADVRHLGRYAAVILGGALYTGRWHPDARHFLRRHREALAALPVAIFGMGPRTMEPAEVDRSRAQLERALAGVPELTPLSVAVFGGVVDPGKLHFPFNRMPKSDARDWHGITDWANRLAAALDAQAAA